MLKNDRYATSGQDFRRVCAHLLPNLRPYRRTLAIAMACMLGATLMELLKPWPLKLVFDVLLVEHTTTLHGFSGWLAGLEAAHGVMLVAAMILVIATLFGLFSYGQAYLTASVGQKVVAAIREQVYAHLQRLSHSFHDESSTGDLLARLTGDIRMMRELLVNAVVYITDRSLVVIGMIGIMLWMDAVLTLVALVILPVLFVLVGRFNGEIKGATRRQRRKESRISHAMTETLSAMSLIQTYAREDHENRQFSRYNAKSTQAGLVTTRLEANMNRIVQVVLATGTAAVIAFGVFRVRAGILTPGDLLVFTAYLTGLYKPVRKLSSITSRIAKATACGERVVSLLETEPDIADQPDAVAATDIQGRIELDDVSFGYRNGTRVLQRASLVIEPGEHVILRGASGAGKSTLGKLLLRFFEPQGGRIRLDGKPLEAYTLTSLRDQYAVVIQDAMLFNTSIRDNIAYGRLDASEEDIIAAAESANIHDTIMGLPDDYDTVISERGSSLSGGQRQRIAIARAIVRRAPVVILDEPLTGIDPEGRNKVEEALARLIEGRTCITITHDRTFAELGHRIVEIDQGRLIDVTQPMQRAAGQC
jgi:ABC-type multidrug transport system fused ATPase/permease subunit